MDPAEAQPDHPAPPRTLYDTLTERMREFAELDPSGGFTRHVVDSFLTRTPTFLADISAAANGHDVKSLRAAAHSLTGSAANVGATTMATICTELQDSSRALDPALHNLIGDLHDAFDEVREAIAELTAGTIRRSQ